MPKYKVQLKQGGSTKVATIEAKSVQAVLDFYQSLSTMQVTEILQLQYEDATLPPVDDMAYYPVCKAFIANSDSNKSVQVYFANMKLNKNENDFTMKAIECLELDNLPIDSVRSILIKNSRLAGG